MYYFYNDSEELENRRQGKDERYNNPWHATVQTTGNWGK
jgi:hypothetical protein